MFPYTFSNQNDRINEVFNHQLQSTTGCGDGISSNFWAYGKRFIIRGLNLSNSISLKKTPEQISFAYANEADLITVALFGMTAKQWRDVNPGAKGNMRDYAGLNQLLVLANMESYNALLIEQKKEQAERLALLRDLAVRQMQTLSDVNMEKLPHLPGKM